MRLKLPLNLCGQQRILRDPSYPSYKHRSKRRNAFLQFAEEFGRRGRADPLCSYYQRFLNSEAIVSLIIRTEMTEDMFAKWAFIKSAKF